MREGGIDLARIEFGHSGCQNEIRILRRQNKGSMHLLDGKLRFFESRIHRCLESMECDSTVQILRLSNAGECFVRFRITALLGKGNRLLQFGLRKRMERREA